MPEDFEEQAEALEDGPKRSFDELDQLLPLEAPYFFPVAYDVALNSNEFTVVCNNSIAIADKGKMVSYTRLDPTCILKLSPGSAKDLAQYLYNSVRQYEQTYGKIVTDRMLMNQRKKDADS